MCIILVHCSRPSLWAPHISQPPALGLGHLSHFSCPRSDAAQGPSLGSVSWRCWRSHTFPKYRADLRQGRCFVHQGAAEALASPETRCRALGNTIQSVWELPRNWTSWDKWETGDKSLAFPLFLMAVSMCLGSYTASPERTHVDNNQVHLLLKLWAVQDW